MQMKLFCAQEAQQKRLLDSRAGRIVSFLREPAKVCARSLVSTDALATKT